jgi:two-component system, OmpR family, response regulator
MARQALIVEDDPDTGQLLLTALRRWGFAPTLLTGGSHDVAWTREHRPELILLDLMLPDKDGYEVCHELKLDRATNLIPLIMVTARTTHEDRVRGLSVGANYYLTKPFGEAQLREAVREAQRWRDELKRHGAHGEVHFHIRSDVRFLEEMNALLASLFYFTRLAQPQVKQLTAVVRELGVNAIEWGHKRQSDRIVTVTYRIDHEKIAIVIRDTGPGFNPGNLPHAAGPGDPVGHLSIREALGLREGGFGIQMARALVDVLEYNDKGNEVRLVKFLPRPEGTVSAAAAPGPSGGG